MFAGLVGGIGRLPLALAETDGVEVRTSATVRRIERTASGFRLTVGSTREPETVETDRVVVAAPGPPAARLLADVAPAASEELGAVEYASMAVITIAVPALDVGDSSGFLVPSVDGRRIKASTYSFNKWRWVGEASDLRLLRASIGRHREEASLQASDEELVAHVVADSVARDGSGGAARRRARPALGRCAAAVRRRSPRPGDPDPGGGRRRARAGGVRSAVRRRRHPGRDRLGPPSCRIDSRGRIGHMSEPSNASRTREINETIRYTMWSVFRLDEPLGPDDGDADRAAEAAEVLDLFEKLAADDVVVRGTYDVAGLRADADVMVWWHAGTSEQLQDAYHRFRRTAFGRRLGAVWSQMALHRPAEFNKSHVPAFLAEEEPRAHLCVYPFVRSYEWYLLEDTERRRLLAEHGQMARGYPDVRANTVPSFALGDYEWILAFEADDLSRIVDLMRHLRGSETRRHVRDEIPFYTGARTSVADLLARLP